jgi:RHS repeat-associated protein
MAAPTAGAADVRLGDMNGDGKLDLVYTGGSSVSVFIGSGNGTFASPTTYPVHGSGNSATLAFINGDGRLDIAVADGFPPGADQATVGILLNTGAGFATEVTYRIGDTYAVTNNVVVADLNGDGVPDLAVSNINCGFNGGDALVLMGTGGGAFAPAVSLADGCTADVAVADVNGDGILDIISSNPSGFYNATNEVRVYLGNGGGTFGAALHYATNATDAPAFLLGVDLNRDGKPDVITANRSSFTTLLNSTVGTFVPIGGPLTAAELRGSANLCSPCWLKAYLHTQIADPVEAVTGNFTETRVDLSVSGRGIPLAFARTYNSQAATTTGPLGYGWTMNVGAALSQNGTTGLVTITQENGAQVTFAKVGTSTPAAYAPTAPRFIARLVNNTDGTWTFTRLSNETLTFNAAGQVTTMADRNGYTTSLTYVSGQLTKITDPAGRSLSLTYTGGQVVKVTDDQTGRNVQFGYTDGAGNLTDVTDVNGGNTHYVYEGGHLLDTVRDQRGNVVTTNHYNAATPRQVDWQQDGLLRRTTFAYGANGSSATITDPKGNVTYDTFSSGLKTTETRGYSTSQAATWSYIYDPVTVAPVAITDPKGHTTYAAYDDSGNVLSTSDALGRTTLTSYNGFNEPLRQTDPLGVTTASTYDGSGNLLTTSRPLTGTSQVQTTTHHYGDATHPSDVTSVTDADGYTSNLTYDVYGDLLSSADPLGNKATHTYNADGWALTDVSPAGNVSGCGCASQYTTTYSYVVPGTTTTDQWGDVQTVTDPLNHVTTYGYDGDRNRTSMKDATGHLTSYVFDVANQQTQIHRADGTTTATDYNLDGTTLDQKDGKGTAIQTYGYNSLAQLTSTTDALGNQTVLGVDGVGNVLTVQAPGGNCATNSRCTYRTYDAANQLLSITYSDGTTPNVSNVRYDGDGQKTSWTDATGNWTQVFDSLHRRTSVTEGRNGTISYSYNLRSLPLTVTYPGGAHTVTETYDNAGRWTGVKDWNAALTTIGYDANSNLVTYTLPTATSIVDTLSYNKADVLTGFSDKKGATTFSSATYLYDSARWLISDSSAPTGQTFYRYTSLQQVCYAGSANSTACSAPPTGANTFSYDAADNLTKLNTSTTTQSFNAADQLCWSLAGASANACASPPAGATRYGYDTSGNRTSVLPTAGSGTCDSYDLANRLTTVQTGTGSSCTSPTTVATYSYDAAGLRMSKTTGGATTTSAWDLGGALPVLLEESTAGTVTDYVYGPGGLALEQIRGTTTLWYHHDNIGSTRAMTDSTGTVQQTYQYGPYGNLVAATGAAVNPLRFAGQYLDSESGLYYLRARYYDPSTGQFLSRDPMVATTRSPYGYVSGNPLNTTDPTGECGLWGSDTCWGDVAGGISSAWNHSIGTFDWGTTAAGVFNMAYGGYKIVTGAEAAAASIGLLFTPPPFDLLAIPAGVASIYQLTTGVAREVRGIRQVVKGATTPAKDCTIGDNALRFGLGTIPGVGAGKDIWDLIGGAP